MNMKRLFKGVATVAIVMVVLIAINMILYMIGIQPPNELVEVLLAVSFGTFIYNSLTKNEKNTDKED